jgi:hypothetical protein
VELPVAIEPRERAGTHKEGGGKRLGTCDGTDVQAKDFDSLIKGMRLEKATAS